MLSAEIQSKIRSIQWHTKRALRGTIAGNYRMRTKGFGLEFEQLADYQFGDDIRFIDWKSSARTNKMLIKEYRDERNRTIMLVVDGSQSTIFGSSEKTKKELLIESAIALAFAALYNKDALGLLIITDQVEVYVPPKNGYHHVYYVIDQLIHYQSHTKKTNLNNALRHLKDFLKYQSIIFMLSDYIDNHLEATNVLLIGKKHELIAVRCLDKHERSFPSCGFIEGTDLETGECQMLDMRHYSAMLDWHQKRLKEQDEFFKKYAISCLDLVPDKPFIDPLIYFLKQQSRMR